MCYVRCVYLLCAKHKQLTWWGPDVPNRGVDVNRIVTQQIAQKSCLFVFEIKSHSHTRTNTHSHTHTQTLTFANKIYIKKALRCSTNIPCELLTHFSYHQHNTTLRMDYTKCNASLPVWLCISVCVRVCMYHALCKLSAMANTLNTHNARPCIYSSLHFGINWMAI